LVVDGWQAPNVIEFVGILARFVDKDYCLQTVPLDFVACEDKTKGKYLAKVLYKVLEEFEITDRIHAITTDNASNMTTMLQELKILLAAKVQYN